MYLYIIKRCRNVLPTFALILIFNTQIYTSVPIHNYKSLHIKLVWLLTSSRTLSSVRASCCCKSSSISTNWPLVSSSVLSTSKSKRHSFSEPNSNFNVVLSRKQFETTSLGLRIPFNASQCTYIQISKELFPEELLLERWNTPLSYTVLSYSRANLWRKGKEEWR